MNRIDKLSVIIPAFNEEATITDILKRVSSVQIIDGISMEVIVVDDCSTDRTAQRIEEFFRASTNIEHKFLSHPSNQGKGAALHTGIQKATGEFLVIQDADLEYNPQEFNDLLEPILLAGADVVYGSRFMGSKPHRILFFWHTIGNKFLTFLSNMFTNLNLTDMETCYKMMRSEIVQSLNLVEKRFGFEPEITAKISQFPNIKIYEVGISYFGRTFEEGKKISWKDGFRAMACILRYNLFK